MIITGGIDVGKDGAIVVLGDGRTPIYYARAPMFEREYVISMMNDMLLQFASPVKRQTLTNLRALFADLTSALSDDSSDDAFSRCYSLCETALLEIDCTESFHAQLFHVEQQRVMEGEGLTSVLSTGRGMGLWEGLLAANRIPYQMVSSTGWTKRMGCVAPAKDRAARKAEHVARCSQLVPDLPLVYEGCRTAHDGTADAALLAVHAYYQIIGKTHGS